MAASPIPTTLLSSLLASLSVLLTISYGVLIAHFKILSSSTAKDISAACVKVFLPALLWINLGGQLHEWNGTNYAVILFWSITYNLLTLVFGYFIQRTGKVPNWFTPAVTFNNTTSLPLLLLQSLGSAGILDTLLKGESDTQGAALDRAKSYFLLNSCVSNYLTFALGPIFLGSSNSSQINDSSNSRDDREDEDREADDVSDTDAETPLSETIPLLPTSISRRASRFHLPSPLQKVVDAISQYINAPLIGVLLGIITGLIPPLHKAFFSSPDKGGFLSSWLTTSLKNLGNLFATLQILVVGIKLYAAFALIRKGQAKKTGKVPWGAFLTISAVRYVVWPAISIPVLYALATRTSIMGDDPVLWFTMMLMPAGPPALKLLVLADVSEKKSEDDDGVSEEEKMAIAKFLAISYTLTPLMAFAVVGSLRASEEALAYQ